jgi:hypothetical protein
LWTGDLVDADAPTVFRSPCSAQTALDKKNMLNSIVCNDSSREIADDLMNLYNNTPGLICSKM